ncbi:MAG: methionyl-tRNA formyltransferase [Pseudomonadota bacterium]
MPLDVVFMGTPDFAAEALKAILASPHSVIAAYSQPPRPAGRRGLSLVRSAVHQLAEDAGVEVRTPASLKDEAAQQQFADLKADVAIVVAYGLLLPPPILEGTRLGCFNGHASLLPRWRGAAPIQRAIMAGDETTGTMVMKMDAGLDTGPVALSDEVPISADRTAGELHDILAQKTAALLVSALDQMEKGELTLTPQAEDGACYAKKITKDETRIVWSKPASEVHNHIRGLAPFPGAWCEIPIRGKPVRTKILRSEKANGDAEPGTVLDDGLTVACSKGAVRLLGVQKAGSAAMSADQFLAGSPVPAGTRLDAPS